MEIDVKYYSKLYRVYLIAETYVGRYQWKPSSALTKSAFKDLVKAIKEFKKADQ